MAASTFSANTHRHDPYRMFKFQVLINGKPVAGLKKNAFVGLSSARCTIENEGASNQEQQNEIESFTSHTHYLIIYWLQSRILVE